MANKKQTNQVKILYLCDGCACPEDKKANCFTNGKTCCHTSDRRHSLVLKNEGKRLQTKFVYTPHSTHVLVEQFERGSNNKKIMKMLHDKDILKNKIEKLKTWKRIPKQITSKETETAPNNEKETKKEENSEE